MQETQVRSLGQEDPLEKEILSGESHGQRSLVGYSPWGHKESDTMEQLHFHFSFIVSLISFSFISALIL